MICYFHSSVGGEGVVMRGRQHPPLVSSPPDYDDVAGSSNNEAGGGAGGGESLYQALPPPQCCFSSTAGSAGECPNAKMHKSIVMNPVPPPFSSSIDSTAADQNRCFDGRCGYWIVISVLMLLCICSKRTWLFQRIRRPRPLAHPFQLP